MHSFNQKNPAILRVILRALLFFTAIAVVASPATAASGLNKADGGTLAAIIAFGMLLFAIVFDVWRMTFRGTAPIRNRATQDWKPEQRDR